MQKIFEILKDKEFQALSYADKQGVLSHFDKGFSVLPPEEQNKVMQHFNLNQPELSPDEQHPVAKAASDIYTPALVTLGGVAGAAAGGAGGVPTGPGAAMTAVAGGALGMAGGEAAAAGIDRMTGLKSPIQTPQAAVSETGQNILHGSEYEAGGRVMGAVIDKTLHPLWSKMTEGAKIILAKAKDMGIDLSPAEVIRSKTLSIFENLLDNLPIAGDFADKFHLSQAKQMIKQRDYLLKTNGSPESIEALGEKIQESADNLIRDHTKVTVDNALKLKNRLLQKLGSTQTYEEVGMSGQEAIKAASEKRYAEAGKLYDSVGEYFDPTAVHQPDTYKAKAIDLLKQQKMASPSLQDSESLSVLNDISGQSKLESMLKDVPPELHNAVLGILKKDAIGGMTWGQMVSDRTRLGKLIAENDPSYGFSKGAKGTKMVSNEAAGVYKQLFKSLDEDMGKVAKDAGPEAEQALELARSYYGESKQLFNTPHILRTAKADPEKVVDMVFKPGAITPIRMARKAMGEEAFDELTKKFTNRLTETSESVPLTADLMKSRIQKYGVDTIEEIYGHNAPDILNLPKQLEAASPELVNNQFFKSLVNKSPEKIVDFLVRPGNTVNASKLAEGLGQDMKAKVGQGLVSKILEDSAINSHGEFSPNMLDSAINKYGDETLKTWVPKDVLKDLKDFAEVATRLPKAAMMGNNPSGTGRMVVGASAGVFFIYNPKKAIKIAVPAATLAAFYFTPTGRKYLTEGLTTSLKSPQAQQMFSRISSSLLNLAHQQMEEDQ